MNYKKIPCSPFLSKLIRSGYFALSCSDLSILIAPLMPLTPPTNMPLTLTLEADELSPVKELLLFDRPMASMGRPESPDSRFLAAIFSPIDHTTRKVRARYQQRECARCCAFGGRLVLSAISVSQSQVMNEVGTHHEDPHPPFCIH